MTTSDPRPHRVRTTSLLTVLCALAVVLLSLPAATASAGLAALSGYGSSWAYPAIDQWSSDIKSSAGISITFQPTGSAAGRESFIEGQADFAASDIPFLTTADPFGGGTETESSAYSYIPIVAGGTSFLYNLKVGKRKITDLRLSGATLTEIFTGQINNWDDRRITADYGTQLPSEHITVVTRADGSGASYEWTEYMATEFKPQWQAFCSAHHGPANCGPTEFYPNPPGGVQKNGSDQVADYIASSEIGNGSIGYDEYSYAMLSHIPVVKMLNSAGYYVGPTPNDVAIALQAAKINEDSTSVDYLIQNLDDVYTYKDPRTYPLSSYSYLIVPRDSRVINGNNAGPPSGFSTAKGASLSTWLNYVLCGAQQSAAGLGYSPLPKPLVQGGFAQDAHIPGAVNVPSPTDQSRLEGCDNPTYSNGVNLLIKDAPYPSACDKVVKARPASCSTQNLAAGGTGAGGSGGGGSRTTAVAGTGSKALASAAAIDPDTGQAATSDTAGGSDAAALASSQTLSNRTSGELGYALLAAFLVLGAIVLPVVIGQALSRRSRGQQSP